MTLYDSITRIDDIVFYECGISDIYYSGTKAQWKTIDIGYDNYSLGNATIHCSDGDIEAVVQDDPDPDPDPDPDVLVWGDFKYEINEDGLVTIKGYTGTDETLNVPAEIDGKAVTEIGACAFIDCTSVKEVIIPDSVTYISEQDAFYGCDLLEKITVGESNENYISVDGVLFNKDKTTLVAYPAGKKGAYTIPESVTELGWTAFDGCKGLTELTIPENIIFIPSVTSNTFSSCTSLEAINISEDNPVYASLDGVLFNKDKTELLAYPCGKAGEYTVPEGVKSLSISSFFGSLALTKVTLPESLTSIGSNAFNNCTALADVNIPDNVASVKGFAFENTAIINNQTAPIKYIDNWLIIAEENIETAEIKEGTVGIAGGAFHSNSALTEINIPYGVAYIGETAFAQCSQLAKITVPDSVIAIDNNAFWGTALVNAQTTPIKYVGKWVVGADEDITEAEIKEGTVGIAASTFMSCSALTSVTIPSGVASIDESTFMYCSSLASVTIPDSVTSIKRTSFEICESLTDVYYSGSKKDWRKIEIDECNEPLLNATIHCSDGDIEAVVQDDPDPDPDPEPAGDFYYSLYSSGVIINSYTGDDTVINYPDEINGLPVMGINPEINDNVTEINIPASVTYIGRPGGYEDEDYQRYCWGKNLAAINVSEDNTEFSSVNGILFNKDKTTMLSCPPAVSGAYTIPESVTSIWWSAFCNCSLLESVIIPESVTYIDENAFYGCSSLKSVTIPKSVTSIVWQTFSHCTSLESVIIPDSVTFVSTAFSDCTSLKDVYYTGSEDDWKKIDIYDGNILNATIHYNYVAAAPTSTPTQKR